MGKITTGLLAFTLILSGCLFTQEQPRQKLKRKTSKAKIVIKKDNLIKKKIQQSKKKKTVSKKRLLAKEDFLPKDYYKPKKNTSKLVEEFSTHLENLKQTCEKQENKKEFLKNQLESFRSFLTASLKDPNMDYKLQLLFADIASLMEYKNYENFIDLDTFNSLYKSFYNLPEDLKEENYPDDWAKTIFKSIECATTVLNT